MIYLDYPKMIIQKEILKVRGWDPAQKVRVHVWQVQQPKFDPQCCMIPKDTGRYLPNRSPLGLPPTPPDLSMSLSTKPSVGIGEQLLVVPSTAGEI